jgi:hypothetical protein
LQIQPTQTDSVALGSRTAVNIDQSGVVSATYNKADGSGTVNLKLYQLASNSFGNANSLTQFGSTGYFQANSNTGTDTILPLGSSVSNGGSTAIDSNGNPITAFSGQLTKPAKTTSTVTTLETIDNKYAQNVYQEALGQQNSNLRYAQYFEDNISGIKNVDQVISDQALAYVVQTVGGLPNGVYSQQLPAQEAAFGKAIDFTQLNNPTYVSNYIQQFLAISDANGTGTSSVTLGWQAGLLGSGTTSSDGSTSIDFSGLESAVAQSVSIIA